MLIFCVFFQSYVLEGKLKWCVFRNIVFHVTASEKGHLYSNFLQNHQKSILYFTRAGVFNFFKVYLEILMSRKEMTSVTEGNEKLISTSACTED